MHDADVENIGDQVSATEVTEWDDEHMVNPWRNQIQQGIVDAKS
jgi:hypothetical protein